MSGCIDIISCPSLCWHLCGVDISSLEFEWSPSVCVQGSSKDIGQLAAALHHRILALKSRAEQEPETQTTTIPETEVPRSNEDDSDEEENASAAASAATPATSQWLILLAMYVLVSLFQCLFIRFCDH